MSIDKLYISFLDYYHCKLGSMDVELYLYIFILKASIVIYGDLVSY